MKITVNKKDIIWSYISTIVSMFSNFLILPFVLRYLDDLSIGLYYVFVSLSAISALFDFGFAASFSRNIAYCWSGSAALQKEGAVKAVGNANTEYALMKKVLFTSKVIYGLLSSVALVIGLTAGTAYIVHISRELSGNVHIISWFIYVAAIFLNLYYGYYASYLRGVGAIQKVSIIITISRIFQVIITAVLLICGTGLLGVCVAYFTYGLFFRFACQKAFYSYNDIGLHLGVVTEKLTIKSVFPLFMDIWYNAWREGIISLSNFLLSQAGTVICSIYFSLYETGLYSLSVQLTTAISIIASTMYNTYQPSLQSAYVRRDIEGQKKSMSMIVITYIGLFVVGMIALLLIGRPIIAWLRPSYALSIPMLLLVGCYQFILKFRNCYTTYFSSTNRLYYMRSFIISAILCVILTVLFAEMSGWGIFGFVIAQILSQAIFNVWYWPVKTHQELNLNIHETFSYAYTGYKQLIFKDSKQG